MLLGRADWHAELRWVVPAAGVLAIVGLLARRLVVLTALVSAVALLIAPTAYALQNGPTAHTGAIPSAGPANAGGFPGGQAGRAVDRPTRRHDWPGPATGRRERG